MVLSVKLQGDEGHFGWDSGHIDFHAAVQWYTDILEHPQSKHHGV